MGIFLTSYYELTKSKCGALVCHLLHLFQGFLEFLRHLFLQEVHCESTLMLGETRSILGTWWLWICCRYHSQQFSSISNWSQSTVSHYGWGEIKLNRYFLCLEYQVSTNWGHRGQLKGKLKISMVQLTTSLCSLKLIIFFCKNQL